MARKRRPARSRSKRPAPPPPKRRPGAFVARWLPPEGPPEPLWRALPWVLAAAFAARAGVALSGDFVVHPDEVMQYLEPAHGLVFGNSVAYWEWFYGARSWLVPGFVAGVIRLCQIVGLGEPAQYVAAVKLAFCAVSLATPLGMYALGRRLFGEPTGRIALLLGAFWYELAGYAHKPMTEFLATPLLLALAWLALGRPSPRRAAGVAVLAVLALAVRFQYAPPVAALALLAFALGGKRERLAAVAAGTAALAAVGAFEFLTWGGFFHSYWLNFRYNVVVGGFRGGESHWFYFLGWPALASGGAFLVAAASGWNFRRRWLLVALAALVLVPHMFQNHREYRFVFAAIPLWLTLFADLLAVGWKALPGRVPAVPSQHRWAVAGLAFAASVSLLGILNAIPYQRLLYVAHSNETGMVRYLRGQDPGFAAYRRLSADPAVKGVLDLTRPYFNTGGYYYLHARVPFYTSQTLQGIDLARLRRYVTHVVAGPPIRPKGARPLADGGFALETKDGRLWPLPGIVGDLDRGRLVFWNERGRAAPIGGFELEADLGDASIWTSADRESPVRRWRDYRIVPDSDKQYGSVRAALGSGVPEPPTSAGIRFAD